MSTTGTREDRERLVSSLGLPTNARAPREYIERGGEISGASLAALVDRDVAERTWLRWNPGRVEPLADPKFCVAFEAMLSSGVGLGYSTDRLRSVSMGVPDLDADD